MKRVIAVAAAGAAAAVAALAGAGGASANLGYCLGGTPGAGGRFLDLPPESVSLPQYAGARPATWVEGIGLTCDLPPKGYLFVTGSLVDSGGLDLGPTSGDQSRIYPVARPVRAGYCTATGTFVNLLLGQPTWDRTYAGLTPATFVQGRGIACGGTPAGYSLAAAPVNGSGVAGGPTDPTSIYPYAVPGTGK